jgi:hypothetical protein
MRERDAFMRIRKNSVSFGLLPSDQLPPAVAERMKRHTFITMTVIGHGETLLRKVCRTFWDGGMPDRRDMVQIVDGLERILAGQSAAKAFGLGQGRGRTYKPDYQFRDQKVAAVIDELRKEGLSVAGAVQWVVEHSKLREATVNGIYKKHQKKQREIARILKAHP